MAVESSPATSANIYQTKLYQPQKTAVFNRTEVQLYYRYITKCTFG